jgi:hypothetical protein
MFEAVVVRGPLLRHFKPSKVALLSWAMSPIVDCSVVVGAPCRGSERCQLHLPLRSGSCLMVHRRGVTAGAKQPQAGSACRDVPCHGVPCRDVRRGGVGTWVGTLNGPRRQASCAEVVVVRGPLLRLVLACLVLASEGPDCSSPNR